MYLNEEYITLWNHLWVFFPFSFFQPSHLINYPKKKKISSHLTKIRKLINDKSKHIPHLLKTIVNFKKEANSKAVQQFITKNNINFTKKKKQRRI